jgi:L-Ala-D/L-Glu epimerase
LELFEPFHIAHGTSSSRQVLRICEGAQTTEAPFVPYYGEVPEETLAILNAETLPENLPRTAGLAMNLLRHDLDGHRANQTLRNQAESILGPPGHATPSGCRSFGIPADLEEFSEKVREVAQQFRVLKLKLGSGDLGYDLAIVSVARRSARGAELMIDVNGGWDPCEAPLMIQKLMDYGPALIEQPIHHRHEAEIWREMRAELPPNCPPIFADESVQTTADLPALAPWIDGVNIKLLKCGSFDEAISLIRMAREYHLSILLGCMIESSLGVTAAAHLAPWADWIDLDGHFYVSNDDFSGLSYGTEGELIMPQRPGIGAVPL